MSRLRCSVPRWRVTPALVTAVLLTSAACTISADEAARPVANPPADLFATTTTVTEPEEPEPDFTLDLYFYNEGEQLVLVERNRDTEATPQDALDALLVGPTQEDVEATKLGPLTNTLSPVDYTAPPGPDANGVLVITVSGEELGNLADSEPTRVVQIFQQIVCTLTSLDPAVLGVQVQDANGLIKVSLADTPVDRPVGRADFGDCVTVEPPPPPTTSTTRPSTTRRPTTSTTVADASSTVTGENSTTLPT